MKHVERITPVTAALSVVTTLLCCLPIGFAAAAATASVSVVVSALRPWLIAASVILVALGFMQIYYGKKSCERSTPANITILWICTAVVVLVVLFPQIVATAMANLLPER